MRRLRLADLRLSRLPTSLGLCAGDTLLLANYVNSAQERLLNAKEAGDEGWWGTFAEVIFNVSRHNPYITCPREIARLEMMDVCGRPVPLNNQFADYIQWGAGRQPDRWQNQGAGCGFWGNRVQGYTRNDAVTFHELVPGNTVRIFATDPADLDGSHRVLLQGIDTNGQVVYSVDGSTRVVGVFVTLGAPFVDSPLPFAQIAGIQKDQTTGTVQFFQVDPATGNQYPLHTMEPSEKTALYRRYYLNHLPLNCCHSNFQNPCQPLPAPFPHTVQVSAMAKLDLVPVTCDTDYCIIQSQEAIINEAEAVRFEGFDNATAHQMADRKHRSAIRLLIGQMANYLGIQDVAVSFSPFGSARPVVSMT
ncbi:MAG TPA: hypothetical protein VMQ76_13695 [Terracidiphilus sp.]|nr:hypothetical protein [Terracidiphilus sp.]